MIPCSGEVQDADPWKGLRPTFVLVKSGTPDVHQEGLILAYRSVYISEVASSTKSNIIYLVK